LLKAVAFGWSQAHLTENAERISELGRLLHDRLATLSDNLAGVGRGLRSAIESYNRTVGSLESRVMPAARRFRELGVAAKQEIGELEVVDAIPRDPVQPRALGAIEGARGK
jgi:DNA recombination protein RmuC